MVARNTIPHEMTTWECTDYQPIQTLKNLATEDLETAEDANCDSCIHNKKNQCEIYVK
jgi:hypothetical protein